jgi:hypothetical protein
MKKTILLCGALLALTATVASAAGVNLAWLNCYGEGTGAQNRVFACTANTGTNMAVGSFIAPAGVGALSGNEVVIDLQSAGATLPAWWQFKNVGTCRTTSLSVNFVANAGNAICVDEFSGGGAGGIGAYNIGYGGNPARARLTMAIATAAPGPIDADVEYFAFNMLINNAKTVGTGACAGCLTPVCIVMNSIKLTQPVGVGDFVLGQPGNGTDSNFITWQGGVIGGSGCPAATPARNATWGSVKSLYR